MSFFLLSFGLSMSKENLHAREFSSMFPFDTILLHSFVPLVEFYFSMNNENIQRFSGSFAFMIVMWICYLFQHPPSSSFISLSFYCEILML